MLVALQLATLLATIPLKVTKLRPWVAPILAPLIATDVPTVPELGLRFVIVGGNVTVKVTPLLARPLTVTTTLPVVAPAGTGTRILVLPQLVGVADAPLKVTVLVPCEAPKLAPLIVIEAPTGPEAGLRLVTLGGGTTVKSTPLLDTPPLTVTNTGPVVAPVGTGTTMLPMLHEVGVAELPLKVIAPVPWFAPKFAPAIVTEVPTGPEVGVKLVMLGAGVTVKTTPLLATPFTVTTTLPVVAPLGTTTEMVVPVKPKIVAAVPLKVTVLFPGGPKFVPVIKTEEPTGPEVGLRLVMVGVGITVKTTPLLATPPTVTTTLPVVAAAGTGTTMLVAFQLVGVPAVPLNVTVLLLWLAPKFAPVIVTDVPTRPEVGLMLVIFGTVATVKSAPLLARPPTVTTTLPVLAPAGTGTRMLVVLQLVGVAVVPLNVTVLAP